MTRTILATSAVLLALAMPALAGSPPVKGHNTTAARRAREERSRRRQATLQPSVAVHHRKATRVLDHTSRRRNCHGKKKHGPPSASTTIQDKDVVRVPMLTGTLILYRGPHRRAEFVRSV